MGTLTKIALGKMGRLRPKPALGAASPAIALPAPERTAGMPLMEAPAARHSLFAAANGPAGVIRAGIDREAIADALGLAHAQEVLLPQTVGYPKGGR